LIVDARELEPGRALSTDVCIIGSGAAGITIALELSNGPRDVVLLESGGWNVSPGTQRLYRGSSSGRPYFSLDSARLRFFGGSTNHWTGMCRPLDPEDLETSPSTVDGGWPLDGARLAPHYARAAELCELDMSLPWDDPPAALPIPQDRCGTALVRFSPPTRFGSTYRRALENAPNVSIVLRANAIEIEPAREGSRVERVHCATLSGNRFTVRARTYVLATGGIENARILLASRSV